jgi:hypothetical protein
MNFEFEGQAYSFDIDDLTVRQAEKIEAYIGGTLMDFQIGLSTVSVKCEEALYWFVSTRGNVDVPISFPDLKVAKWSRVVSDAQAAETAAAEAAKKAAEEAAAEPGPTMPAPSAPSPAPAPTPTPPFPEAAIAPFPPG